MRRIVAATQRVDTKLSLVFGLLLAAIITSNLLADSLPKIADTSSGATPGSGDSLPLIVANSNQPILTFEMSGPIGAVTDDRLTEALKEAERSNAQLLIIMMDTPGGFTGPTFSMIKKILNSSVPVCVYIAPDGSRAGSAGVFLTYAAHFAAMAPTTNIGAAHPVSGGQELDSIMNEKVTNDAVAQILSTADKRGRNREWAEKAVRQSVSIPASEALSLKVIDFIARDTADLFAQLDGRQTETPDRRFQLNVVGAPVRAIETSFLKRLLTIITHPDIAFILLSLGTLGIIIELYNPGAILPGVVGAISLILAFYSFQTLPVNWAGVLLIVLAFVLFIAEIKIVSFGLLTVGGVISLILGGAMLIDTADPALRVSTSILATVGVLVLFTLLLIGWVVTRTTRGKSATGPEGLIGKVGPVKGNGFVFIEGALWRYRATQPVAEGSLIRVEQIDGLTLIVTPHEKVS